MGYYDCGKPHTWHMPFKDLVFMTLNVKALCKEIEPHWNAESPLQRIGPPGHIPDDRFHLFPDWANIHRYAMEWYESGIVV